jgi:hypothetical protein
MNRVTSVQDHKLAATYESLRAVLNSASFSERTEKPLAFWALPSDRRLPLALLGYPVKELMRRSLEELAATPGIGKKKLHSLIKLLHRATTMRPAGVPALDEESPKASQHPGSGDFDPTMVSEVLWEQWRETVRRHGLERETLGRLAPSLQRLPTVIWRVPLSEYLNTTVAEMRRLKTHGEKRVNAILEVFHSIHYSLAHVPGDGHLGIDVRPGFVAPIERWIARVLKRTSATTAGELKQWLILPILEQVRIDAGPEIYRLVEERLGIRTPPYAVQQQAKRLGVTRARVYQLLETCGEIMSVRWPEGDEMLGRLRQKLAAFPHAKPQLAQLRAVRELVYPQSDRPAVPEGANVTADAQQDARAPRAKASRHPSVQHKNGRNGAYRASPGTSAIRQ